MQIASLNLQTRGEHFAIHLSQAAARLFAYAFSLSTWWMSKSLCPWWGCWVNPRFFDTRDEAYTQIPFHAVHIEQLNPGNTVIRCYDIDIPIIMLSNIQKFKQSNV